MPSSNPDPSISWEEPPPQKGHRPSKWDAIANALKANPGKWAKVVTNGQIGIKSDAEHARYKCFRPEGSFEGRARLIPGRRWEGDVWLRYIGENGEFKDVP